MRRAQSGTLLEDIDTSVDHRTIPLGIVAVFAADHFQAIKKDSSEQRSTQVCFQRVANLRPESTINEAIHRSIAVQHDQQQWP